MSYSKKGVTVHRFPSLLPGGSSQTGKRIPGKAPCLDPSERSKVACISIQKAIGLSCLPVLCWTADKGVR